MSAKQGETLSVPALSLSTLHSSASLDLGGVVREHEADGGDGSAAHVVVHVAHGHLSGKIVKMVKNVEYYI